MNVENYLKKLESNCLLRDVMKTPPPEMSNFYWKNDNENKYKAFIPTPDRNLYYNLEEYEGVVDISQIDNYGWKYAKKCVLLAVSNIYTEDQPFIKQMESLIVNLTAPEVHDTKCWKNAAGLCDAQNELYKHTNRHYVITKYFVDKIKNVPTKKRGLFAEFKETLTITSEHGNANIIDVMDIAFELAAKRFVDDLNCTVYSYPVSY